MSESESLSDATVSSKADVFDSYGFRGEALASLVDIAQVEVTSRTLDSESSYSAIRRGGRRVSNGPASAPIRQAHGTVVQVRDLFYKVRRLNYHSADAHSGPSEGSLRRPLQRHGSS